MAQEIRQREGVNLCLHGESRRTAKSPSGAKRNTLKQEKEEKINKEKKNQEPRVKLQPVRGSGMDPGLTWINLCIPTVLSEEEG